MGLLTPAIIAVNVAQSQQLKPFSFDWEALGKAIQSSAYGSVYKNEASSTAVDTSAEAIELNARANFDIKKLPKAVWIIGGGVLILLLIRGLK